MEVSEKEKLETELKALKAEDKERREVARKRAEVEALKAKNAPATPAPQPRKDIGGSGIVDMLMRNHYRNAIFLLGLFCGLLTQLVF